MLAFEAELDHLPRSLIATIWEAFDRLANMPSGIQVFRPDGRFHLRDVLLSGPVSGDGTVNLTLNANLDQPGGSGPAWGTMTIVTTNGDVWQGALTGSFQGFGPGAIQLSSHVVLNGPDQHLLRADCNETAPTSETLVCAGDILTVHS